MTRISTRAGKIAIAAACGSFALLMSPALQARVNEQDAIADGMASLNIAPLRFDLEREDTSATLRLTNTSSRPMPVQTRVFGWSQADGEDRYAPSSDFTVSPSIASIPPGQTQIVRVIRRAVPGEGEKRFRLAIDQLPDPDSALSGGAQALLRFTIPVFVDRETAEPARLEWCQLADRIELANLGGQTSRVIGLKVKTLDGRDVPVERNSLRYVQGSSTIEWPMQGGCGLGRVTITAQLDGQAVDVEPISLCG